MGTRVGSIDQLGSCRYGPECWPGENRGDLREDATLLSRTYKLVCEVSKWDMPGVQQQRHGKLFVDQCIPTGFVSNLANSEFL